jgi:predicted flavoprotein YhiN
MFVLMKRIYSYDVFFRHHRHSRVVPSSLPSSTPSTTTLLMSAAAASASNDEEKRTRIAVIGGGASGMFAATAAADAASSTDCDVIAFEATSKTMSKVRISGGGRCNVMHDVTKSLPQILSSYPRGHKELRGLYTKRFTKEDAYEWFTSRGVELKTESDGRMFPVTDNSQTIIDTITHAAIRAGVVVRTKSKIESVEWINCGDDDDIVDHKNKGKFAINISSRSTTSGEKEMCKEFFDALILATGSFPLGHDIARSLGHNVIKPVPSLFTFDTKDLVQDGGTFHGLAGLSVPHARLTLTVSDEMKQSASDNDQTNRNSNDDDGALATTKTKKRRKKKASVITQEGPLLITHHGISGPATLRLSAFAAREFNAVNYNCEVRLHFCPMYEEGQRQLGSTGGSEDILMESLWEMTRLIPKRRVSTGCPLFMKDNAEENALSGIETTQQPNTAPIIPKRLWAALVSSSSIPSELVWGEASKAMIRSLAINLTSFTVRTTGFSSFKEEFVTAGGVSLKEVQLTNMESKIIPGLFMAGEVLDVDGVTGGFNFMNCWASGFVSGSSAAEYCDQLT